MPPTQLLHSVIAERLFQIAAIIKIVSVAGHIKYGIDYFYPALKVIPNSDKLEEQFAKVGSIGVWNYANVTFFITGLLYWQWAQTGGPETTAEQLMFWVMIIMDVLGGWKYLKIGYYQPLIPLWYANAFGLGAYLWASRVG